MLMANWNAVYTNGYDARDNWTQEMRAHNVDIIASHFGSEGWTINAIAGMVGNMQPESYLNPGQWQHGYNVEHQPPDLDGFGLVQWTPWTKYSNWAGSDWRTNYDKQLLRIDYEFEQGEGFQWITTRSYPLSFAQFSQSTETPEYLARAFFANYERGTGSTTPRENNARTWYNYLLENPPGPVPGGSSKMKIMFYLKPKWKRGLY